MPPLTRAAPVAPRPSRAGGFALFESGSVSPLHTIHVALKNIADFSVGSCLFAVCGYAFAW